MAFPVTKDSKGRALMSCLKNKFFLFFLFALLQKALPFEQEDGMDCETSMLQFDKAAGPDWTLFTHRVIEEIDESRFLDDHSKGQECCLVPEGQSLTPFFCGDVSQQSSQQDLATVRFRPKYSSKRDLNRERIAAKKNRLRINLSKYLGEKSAFLQLLEQDKELKSFLFEAFAQASVDLTRTRRYQGTKLNDLYKKAFEALEKCQDQWLSPDKKSIDKDWLRRFLKTLFACFVAAK